METSSVAAYRPLIVNSCFIMSPLSLFFLGETREEGKKPDLENEIIYCRNPIARNFVLEHQKSQILHRRKKESTTLVI